VSALAAAARRALVVPVALAVGLAGGGAIGFMAQGRPPPTVLPSTPPGQEQLPEAEPVDPDTLLAWTPGGLPPGLGAEVRELPGVEHVVTVVSGTAWMTSSATATGAIVDSPPAGLAIPLEVAAASLGAYRPFLSPADRALLPSLARGEAVLGKTSAELRRAGPGSSLSFGGRSIGVAGVVPDGVVGAHELFVSRKTALALGVARERYLLIDPAPGASRRDLTSGIRELLPPGGLLRVRGPGETPFFRHGDAVLAPVRLKQVFGEFAAEPIAGGYLRLDPSWVADHIRVATVPILGRVQCNRALIPQLRGALAELEAEGLGQLLNPGDYGGCYSARFLNRIPEAGISHHTWGVAVDVNVSTNQFGRVPHQDPRVVEVFERWGFTWGGHWLLPDGMHFEFVRFASGA
jgi:hypothetical protein